MTVGHTFRNVAELALGKFAATKHPNFNKIFDVKVFNPECRASPELAQKYGIAMDNVQQVVAIQNLVTSDLTWWNPARKTKPQNFKTATATTIHDPTGGGGATCDFCSWKELTAEDTFGRVEGTYAVTASNLFKYGAPYQGVVMFKHHDPLLFNLPQLCDLLTVADGWFQKAVLEAQKENIPSNTTITSTPSEKDQLYPLLVWNCLGRAGASQFHPHAQVMVSGAPFPAIKRESDAIMQYKMQHSEIESDACYYRDLVEAHAVAGLARRLVLPLPFYPSRDSGADIIWDDKVLIDTPSLNPSSTATAHCFVNLCPTKDAEIVIHGASLTCPAFQMLVYAALRALIDDLGVESFNAGINNIPIATATSREIENRNRNSAPVVARVVSRGKASGGASDFGGLEVFAGASIGHTDPWIVLQALDTRLKQTIHE